MSLVQRYRPLALALLGAVAVRLSYALELIDVPEVCFPAVDAEYHRQWASALVSSQWASLPDVASVPHTPFMRPPGYPYALAGIFAVFGTTCTAPVAIQMVLGLANVVLAFVLARRLFDDVVANVAALLMGIYWAFIYFEAQLLPPVLLTTLLLAWWISLTYWEPRPGSRVPLVAGVASGVLLGLAALVRPNALVCVLPAIAWALWLGRCHQRADVIYRCLGGFVLALCLCVGAATARNLAVADQWVLISANGGVNLRIGNHAGASGLFVGELPGLGRFGDMAEYPALMHRVSEQEGRDLNESEVSSVLARRALGFVVDEPAATVRLLFKKLGYLLGRDEHGHNQVIALDRQSSVTLRTLPGDFGLAAALALVGLIIAWQQQRAVATPAGFRNWPAAVLLAASSACYGASFLPFFVTGQYRVPFLPPLLIFAAVTLTVFARWVRASQWPRALACAASVGGLYVATVFMGSAPGAAHAQASWEFQRGSAYLRGGAQGLAAQYLERSIATDPQATTAAHDLAFILERTARLDQAQRVLKKALSAGAPQPGELRTSLGNVYLRQSRFGDAETQYRLALEMRDDLPTAHTNLGSILLSRGDSQEAIEHLRRALYWRPESQVATRLLSRALSMPEQGSVEDRDRDSSSADMADPAD